MKVLSWLKILIQINVHIVVMVLDSIRSVNENVVMFEVDMNSSAHIDNKKKYVLILGKSPTQRLNGATLTAKAQY